MCIVVTTAAAGVWCCCWLAARRRDVQYREWTRLAGRLRDLDEDLDRVWAVEKERTQRNP